MAMDQSQVKIEIGTWQHYFRQILLILTKVKSLGTSFNLDFELIPHRRITLLYLYVCHSVEETIVLHSPLHENLLYKEITFLDCALVTLSREKLIVDCHSLSKSHEVALDLFDKIKRAKNAAKIKSPLTGTFSRSFTLKLLSNI